MTWHHITYFISIIITAAVMGFIAWYSRKHRNTVAAAGIYMWIALLVGLISILQGISMIGPTEVWALFWFNMRIVCFAAIPVLWLVFVLHFVGKKDLLSKPRIALLFVIPVITQVMLWTNDWHGLWVVREVGFHQAGPFYIPVTAVRVLGPWFKVHNLYTYVLMLAGLVILFAMSLRMHRRFRSQAFMVGTGTLFMLIGALFPTFNLVPGIDLNPLPQSFALGSIIIAWGLYRHRFLSEMPRVDREKPIPSSLIAIFIALTVGILATAFLYYRQYREHYRAEVERQLSAIVELKVSDLVHWRAERFGNGNALHGNTPLIVLVRRFISDPADADAQWQLRTWMGKIQSAYRYDRIYLVDARGIPRLSVPDTAEPVCEKITGKTAEILRSGAVAFMDFHRESSGKAIHLAVVVPIIDNGRPLGIIALFIDPAVYLYPMINRWPTPSRTAETLLVRRDGEDVLFLNELKFQKNTALNLRVPLKNDNVAAVMAVKGREGIVEGIDYRGVPVIAAVHSVPDSPWFMVARMDISEVYAPVRERFWVMIIAVIGLLVGTGAGIWILWRRQGDRFIRERAESAEALRETNEYLESLINYANAPIIVWDQQFRITRFNHAFESLTGRTADEIIGQPIGILFPPELATASMEHIRKTQIGERWETVEIRIINRDGSVKTVLWNSATIFSPDGKTPVATIAQGYDITERKRAVEALKKSDEKFSRAFQTSPYAITITCPEDGLIIDVNDAFFSITGFTRDEVMGGSSVGLSLWANEGDRTHVVKELMSGRKVNGSEFQFRKKNGEIITGLFSADIIDLKSGRFILSSINDITERKRMEKMLADNETRLRTLVQTIPDLIWLKDSKGVYLFCNPTFERFFGAREADIVGKTDYDFMEREQADFFRGKDIEALAAGKPSINEEWVTFADDGHSALLETIKMPMIEKDGRLIGVLGISRDITERKRAEELLRASEVRYRRLFEAAKDGILILDAGTGMIVDVNPFMIDMLGFSNEQFLGKTIWDIGFFKDIIPNKDKFLELQEKEYVRYADLPLETADGRRIDVEFVSNVYEIDRKKVIQCNIRDNTERIRMQKALFEISSHQESLLSAIPDIVMEVDINKVYTWANKSGIEFFGDDVIGREAAFYFEVAQDTYQTVQPIFDGDENVVYLESWQRRRDGEKRLLAWWCGVLKDERGKVTGALSSARDITELKRAEETLKVSEDKFRGIFEHSTVGKSLTSPDGSLLQINRAFADILGYTTEELRHVNITEITHTDDISESRECIRCLLADERKSYRMEKRYFDKNGNIVWADVSTRLHRDVNGKPEYFITSIVNITERKRAEAELRIKNQVFEDSIASQSIADSEGIITHVNPAFLRLWGYATKEQAIGNSVGSFFDDPDDSAPVFKAMASHDSWEGRFRAKRADGGTFISHGYSTTMRDPGGTIIGYQSTNLDVSAQYEAENKIKQYSVELERSNVDLQQFAYVASHDLQEPLRMISSYLQLIEKRYKDRLDADANDFINFAVDGANRLQSLIIGLLEFSRVRTHGKPFDRVDVKEVLDNLCRDLELQITETGATIEYGVLPVIRADETQIARLFQNLIQNAIKFRREGTAPLVEITVDSRNGERIFCVRDNGIGIEEQYLERIFVIFQRLHAREEYPGTGIGLAICKRIVERHGGRIWVESKYGEGSSFYFSIPALDVTNNITTLAMRHRG